MFTLCLHALRPPTSIASRQNAILMIVPGPISVINYEWIRVLGREYARVMNNLIATNYSSDTQISFSREIIHFLLNDIIAIAISRDTSHTPPFYVDYTFRITL